MKLFPATAALEYGSIDIVGELIGSNQGNRYILVITDLFTKLTRMVVLKNISAPDIAKCVYLFIQNWMHI